MCEKGLTIAGDSESVEGCSLNFDTRFGVPVVELVAVLIQDGSDRGAVAVLGFAHEDGPDFAKETMSAMKKIDLGAFDVDLDEAGWRGVFEQPVKSDAEDLIGLACAAGLRVFSD